MKKLSDKKRKGVCTKTSKRFIGTQVHFSLNALTFYIECTCVLKQI